MNKLAQSATSRDWRLWLHNLAAAAISGAGSAVGVMVVDPDTFNFSTGLAELGKVAAVSAVIGVGLYLKTHPLAGGSKG